MSEAHVEWKRKYVTKYSTLARMKNGLRKTYFSENNCNHDTKTIQELECSICESSLECCRKCYKDFTEDNVAIDSWDDLVCSDCLESCHKCGTIIAHDNGIRSDEYPHEFFCQDCSEDTDEDTDEDEK